MALIRSERFSAGLLLAAAVIGLLVANTAAGPGFLDALHAHLPIPGTGLDLSVSHWISDGLLAVFFFIVAVELKRELAIGDLNSPAKAALPAIAALGGVIVPAGIYLLFAAGSGFEGGWPVPTATDIAFALGVLAVFGRSIPNRVRVFLLALAVLDDLVAILIIAFFFTQDLQPPFLGFAAATVAGFGGLSLLLKPRSAWILARRPQWPVIAAMIVLGLATWVLVYSSGVHATIAGVVLGLVIARRPGGRAHHILEPYSNAVVLPVFALSAAAVAIPPVSPGQLSPAFWGIVVALPVGKFLGITLAGALAALIATRGDGPTLRLADVAVVGALGGIGFTVSLLMNELAFARSHEVADEGTLAVLLGSGISIVFAAIAVTLGSRHYARATRPPAG